MDRMQQTRSRFSGGMLGATLGEAIGELKLHRTDDAAMAIGIAEFLIATGTTILGARQ